MKPNNTYIVSFKLKAELPEKATAGLGILVFNEYLWIGEQYTESRHKGHYREAHESIRLTGTADWEEHRFSFTTGPGAWMIHLVLFRERAHDRSGVLFDDLRIIVAPLARRKTPSDHSRAESRPNDPS